MWAQEFAALNRAEMMDRLIECVEEWAGEGIDSLQHVSCHHNYTLRERHFGKDVWVSRKGAIDAHEGVWGLIPGSMGTRSYVVQGKGNPAALCSAPHGAGREHSRNEARKKFTVEDLRTAMAGIEYRDTDAFVDEHPAAYKPIDVVMEDAADLVEVVHELRQFVNVKGD
jgi:tRNA-splicing ligase RtcB